MNTEKFTGLAENYAKYRPTYSRELIDWLYNEVGFANAETIVDVGAGTGIFAKLLLERGSRVYCVEPNADMMSIAREYLAEYRNCEFIASPAENINLPDKCSCFITSAQAFHWFDMQAFKAECKRLLKDGGKAAIIWNSKKDSDITAVFDAISRKYCPKFKGREHRGKSIDHSLFFKNGVFEQRNFSNDYSLNKDNFIGE